MLFFLNKKSVSVCYSFFKIGIGKVKILKIGKNWFTVNRSIPTDILPATLLTINFLKLKTFIDVSHEIFLPSQGQGNI